MQVVESIKKAREKNVSDNLILQEIRKQNPDKNPFFEKAIERGATPTKILDEIIKQNTPKENTDNAINQVPPINPTPPSSTENIITPMGINSVPLTANETTTKPEPLFTKSSSGNETTNKTLLTKEAQAEEEDMRKRFLKRIEAKERGEITDEGQFFSPTSSSEKGHQGAGQEMVGGVSSSRSPKLFIIIAVGVVLFVLFAFLIFSLF